METTVNRDSTIGDIFRLFLSLLIPPLGVFLEVGISKHFFLSILLTILGYIPGVLHAAYIIFSR